MPNNYKVLSIDQVTVASKTDGIGYEYLHTIETAKGTVVKVQIPEKDMTEEKVREILTAKATLLDNIKK